MVQRALVITFLLFLVPHSAIAESKDFRVVRDEFIQKSNQVSTLADAQTLLKNYQDKARIWKKSKQGNLSESEETLYFAVNQDLVVIRNLDMFNLELSNCHDRLQSVHSQMTTSGSEDFDFQSTVTWMERMLNNVCFGTKSPSSVKTQKSKKAKTSH
jgi:3-dehydroquinate dehydratase